MAYQDILENLITSLPGINGAFIYNNQQGVLESKDVTQTNTVQKAEIGKVFSQAFFMMSVHFNDINTIRLNYQHMTLLGGRFRESDYLVVLCGPDISSGMTRITVQMAINNLKELADPAQQLQTSDLQPDVQESPPVVNTDTLLEPDSSLAKPLIQIRQELAKLIGPVADILFSDVLNDWAQQYTPSLDTLDQLIELLANEIGTKSDGDEFRNSVSQLL